MRRPSSLLPSSSPPDLSMAAAWVSRRDSVWMNRDARARRPCRPRRHRRRSVRACGPLTPLRLIEHLDVRTQPTAMAALPAHPVIQYDQAFTNPCRLPMATRAYASGPPSAGMRREGADGREGHRDERDRPVARKRRRQVEDANADDGADDERRGAGKPQTPVGARGRPGLTRPGRRLRRRPLWRCRALLRPPGLLRRAHRSSLRAR